MSQQLDNATEDTMNNYTKMRSIIMCLINSLGAQTPNQKITVYILDGENIQNIMANCHYSFQCQEVAGSDGTIYSEIKKLIASNNYYDTVPFYIIVNKKPQINTENPDRCDAPNADLIGDNTNTVYLSIPNDNVKLSYKNSIYTVTELSYLFKRNGINEKDYHEIKGHDDFICQILLTDLSYMMMFNNYVDTIKLISSDTFKDFGNYINMPRNKQIYVHSITIDMVYYTMFDRFNNTINLYNIDIFDNIKNYLFNINIERNILHTVGYKNTDVSLTQICNRNIPLNIYAYTLSNFNMIKDSLSKLYQTFDNMNNDLQNVDYKLYDMMHGNIPYCNSLKPFIAAINNGQMSYSHQILLYNLFNKNPNIPQYYSYSKQFFSLFSYNTIHDNCSINDIIKSHTNSNDLPSDSFMTFGKINDYIYEYDMQTIITFFKFRKQKSTKNYILLYNDFKTTLNQCI